MTKGTVFIGLCILASGLIIGAAIWLTNLPPAAEPSGERPGRLRADLPDTPPAKAMPAAEAGPKPIVVQKLTGTLVIEIPGNVYRSPGWLFVNGELKYDLKSPTPARKELLLTPGEYEVRSVILFPPPNSDYLLSTSDRIVIKRGEKYFHTFFADPAHSILLAYGEAPRKFEYPPPAGPGAFRGRTVWHCRAPARKERIPFWVAYKDSDMDALVRKTAGEITQEWKKLLDSNRWQPLMTAAERLRTSPPTRRRVWIDLPDELGGPREVDAGQLRWLRDWLLIEFESATYQVPKEIAHTSGDAEGARRARACQPQLEALNRQVNDWRHALEKTLNDMSAALEKAPEDK